MGRLSEWVVSYIGAVLLACLVTYFLFSPNPKTEAAKERSVCMSFCQAPKADFYLSDCWLDNAEPTCTYRRIDAYTVKP